MPNNLVIISGKIASTPQYSINEQQTPILDFWLEGDNVNDEFLVRVRGEAAISLKTAKEGTLLAIEGELISSDKVKSLSFVQTDKVTLL